MLACVTVFLHHLTQTYLQIYNNIIFKGKYCPVLFIRKYFQQMGNFCGRFKRGRHKGYANRTFWYWRKHILLVVYSALVFSFGNCILQRAIHAIVKSQDSLVTYEVPWTLVYFYTTGPPPQTSNICFLQKILFSSLHLLGTWR